MLAGTACRHALEFASEITTGSFVSFYPAFVAPYFAAAAAASFPMGDGSAIMTVVPSNAALRAVGISVGYMAYDTIYVISHTQVR